jgi:hypothetical protein
MRFFALSRLEAWLRAWAVAYRWSVQTTSFMVHGRMPVHSHVPVPALTLPKCIGDSINNFSKTSDLLYAKKD